MIDFFSLEVYTASVSPDDLLSVCILAYEDLYAHTSMYLNILLCIQIIVTVLGKIYTNIHTHTYFYLPKRS